MRRKQMKFKCTECGSNEFILKSRMSKYYDTDSLTIFPDRERDVDWCDDGEVEENWVECNSCGKEYDSDFSLSDVRNQLIRLGVLI
jgi:hypothetical protein